MHSYDIQIPETTLATLAATRGGVVRVGVSGRAVGLEGFFGCEIELASGEFISVGADQRDLEYKFEVFPITAGFPAERYATETKEVLLTAPVEVMLLRTQDWLDSGIPCVGAIGNTPIMQCQGAPGRAPDSAVAACTYFGGVEFRGANGNSLRVATLPFPYAIYVSCFDGGAIDSQDYSTEVLNHAG
jgi:hypothetical protein